MPSKEEIAELKRAHPLESVLRDLGIPVDHQRFRCLRPERHKNGDRTPSVSFRPEDGTFRCWVCPDIRGDIFDLLRLSKGLSFKEALIHLQGSPRPFPAPPGRPSAAPAPRSTPQSAPRLTPHSKPRSAPPEAPPEIPPSSPVAALHSRFLAAPSAGPEAPGSGPSDLRPEARIAILRTFLRACLPVQDPKAKAAAAYLMKRRIFRRTWDACKLRYLADYPGVSRILRAAHALEELQAAGLFNEAGNLRYFRHPLLFPYLDFEGNPVYFQARALAPEAQPKELSLKGRIPLPFNAPLLKNHAGVLYICEGVIDTLTLLEQNFPAVGIPGVRNFKPGWVPLFKGKIAYVAFDGDEAGEEGAKNLIRLLTEAGIEAHRTALPENKDINEWLR